MGQAVLYCEPSSGWWPCRPEPVSQALWRATPSNIRRLTGPHSPRHGCLLPSPTTGIAPDERKNTSAGAPLRGLASMLPNLSAEFPPPSRLPYSGIRLPCFTLLLTTVPRREVVSQTRCVAHSRQGDGSALRRLQLVEGINDHTDLGPGIDSLDA